jgi:putative DNA primase/helicase
MHCSPSESEINQPDKAADYQRQRQQDGRACLAAALDYLARGWSVLAACPPNHVGVGKRHAKECGSPGKRPWHSWKQYQIERPTAAQVESWWREQPLSNVAIALGPVSGLIRVDVDGPAGEQRLQEISGGNLPPTLQFLSGRPNGGFGLLYAIPPGVSLKTTVDSHQKKEELRFQAQGALTVLPPSRHASGSLYAWVAGRGPGEIEAALAPAWLVELLRADDERPAAAAVAGEPAADGELVLDPEAEPPADKFQDLMRRKKFSQSWGRQRDDLKDQSSSGYDMSLAAMAVRAGWDDQEIVNLCIAHRRNHGAPLKLRLDYYQNHVLKPARKGAAEDRPLDVRVKPSSNGDGHDAGAGPTTTTPVDKPEIHLTDLGNAREVLVRHGGDLHYAHPLKCYYVWDGRRWQEDATAEVVRRVKETQGFLYRQTAEQIKQLAEADGEGEEDQGRKARLAALLKQLRHYLGWEQTRAIENCLASMRSEPGVPVLPSQLDTDPFLFNVLNGTIDLRTGHLRPHSRADLLTKLAPVEYDPDARCPLWVKFLYRIMDGNTDLITYLQRVAGYAATGDVSEQSLWFFYGGGSNGKSTFLGVLLALFGDYAMQAVCELLMVRKSESHPTERADLFGKRLVATIETEEGRRLAEALVKQLTGGDKIRARKLYKDFFQFDPTHKIFLAANHKPVVRGLDLAVWRRIKLTPFTVTIPDEEKDKHLPEKLKAELPGILAWVVRGCLDWQRHGLGEPEEVRQATAEYQAEMDLVAGFIAERCFVHPDARAQAGALLEAYQAWCGDKSMTGKTLSQRLKDKGYQNKPGARGYVFYHGLGLRDGQVEDG